MEFETAHRVASIEKEQLQPAPWGIGVELPDRFVKCAFVDVIDGRDFPELVDEHAKIDLDWIAELAGDDDPVFALGAHESGIDVIEEDGRLVRAYPRNVFTSEVVGMQELDDFLLERTGHQVSPWNRGR